MNQALYKHLAHILFLPRIFGSFMFNLNGQLQYIQIARIVLCSIGFLYVSHEEFLKDKIHFHDMVIILHIIFDVSASLILLCASWQKEHLRQCLDAIEKVSIYLNTTEFKTVLWPSIFSNALLFAMVLGRISTSPEPALRTLTFLQTILLANGFSDELSSILILIGSLTDALTTRLIWTIRREDLDLMLKAQDLLCSAVRHINQFYAIQILMLVMVSFYGATTFCYFFLKSEETSFMAKLTSLMWIFAYLQLSFKITYAASSLTGKMHMFDIRLYELLKTRPGCWTELVKVEDLLIDRSVSISAAGFFELTIENFGSMISAATTYLVILLQMD